MVVGTLAGTLFGALVSYILFDKKIAKNTEEKIEELKKSVFVFR